jgi:hypothetical protein
MCLLCTEEGYLPSSCPLGAGHEANVHNAPGIAEAWECRYVIICFDHITCRLTCGPALSEDIRDLTHAVMTLTEGQNTMLSSFGELEKLMTDDIRPKVIEIHEMLTTLSATRAATSAATRHMPSVPLFPSGSATASTSSLASSADAASTGSSSVHLPMPTLSITDSQAADVSGSGPPPKSSANKGKTAGTSHYCIVSQCCSTDSH